MAKRLSVTTVVLAAALAACSAAGTTGPTSSPPTVGSATPSLVGPPSTPPASTTTAATSSIATTVVPTTTTDPLPAGVTQPPHWLGTRALPITDDGFGEVQATPPELVDRRFTTEDLLDPPENGGFVATIDSVPLGVAARSTWHEGCPVTLDDLRYLTVSFRGFDQRAHTGELMVSVDYAEDVVGVFETLWDVRYPIEEMRITAAQELELPPTGDGNNTESFVCRPATGGSSWSRHAYGRAIDVNPFHNPYHRGEVVLPELSSAYLDRERDLPGMLAPGDPVVEAFAAIGWEWGGYWSTLKDYQHFSDNGR
jgi:D-alanyl-D-alanine carboxypeptidase